MTDASTEGQPTGVIEEEASPHVSYTTQVGLGSKRHHPSPVHAPLSNGIQFMGIYAEYDQHISIFFLATKMYGRFLVKGSGKVIYP